MGRRPVLLDLFCGAGGAAVGYSRAGFDVVGVDCRPQPNYPFRFVRGDALRFWDAHHSEFDAWHASPPCQSFTEMLAREREGGRCFRHPDLLSPTLERFRAGSVPWIVENVRGARRFMRPVVTLHGGMFGLEVYRPRLFESNMLLLAPYAPKPLEPIAVYGDHPEDSRTRRTDGHAPIRRARTLSEGRRAMGIGWMDWRELCESIPPAYTEHLGSQLGVA